MMGLQFVQLALFLQFLLLFGPQNVSSLLSRRAKCAVECYAKCANSGTPKAVYCNCPVNIEADGCDSIDENLLTEKTVERLIESESSYKDVRTILMRVEAVENAFIYIFEFSVQSAERPIWTFAGASSAPQITLGLPDACRDYQFRLLVVLRSTDSLDHLVVFRPKTIPAQFPPFIVPKESIHMDRPKQSSDGQTLHVSISWQHPAGYDDADIYGYSPPTAYPIRCQTPEDRLSQPRLELVQGGARLHLALPVDVLQERCRIYMEVRMLPRCVRIEAFDIQISVELDCQKFPNLRYCRREQSPQCTDVVDLWGKENGKAIVVWQRPSSLQGMGIPLFYVLNWGPAQSQGVPPFVTRRIVQNEQIRVPGNTTKAELGPQAGVQYGLQICAFYKEKEWTATEQSQQENPFHIVPVIPFTCTPCQNKAAGACVDCSKIEESSSTQKAPITPNLAQSPDPVECIGPLCAAANHSSVHFISSDTVVLDVFGAKVSVPSTEMTTTMQTVGGSEGGKNEGNEGGRKEEKEEGWIPQERPFKQRHSKTHFPNEPIAFGAAGEESTMPTTQQTLGVTNEEKLKESTPKGEAEGLANGLMENGTAKCADEIGTNRWRMGESIEGKKEEKMEGEEMENGRKKEEEELKGNKEMNEKKEGNGWRKSEDKGIVENGGNGGELESKGEEQRRMEPTIKITQRRPEEGIGEKPEKGMEIEEWMERGDNVGRVQFVENEALMRGTTPREPGTQRRLHQSSKLVERKKGDEEEEGTKECRQMVEDGGGEGGFACGHHHFCPLVTDWRASFDNANKLFRFFSPKMHRALRSRGIGPDGQLHILFGELEEEKGEKAAKLGARKEHWMLKIKDLDGENIFDPVPLSIKATQNWNVERENSRQFGLIVCAIEGNASSDSKLFHSTENPPTTISTTSPKTLAKTLSTTTGIWGVSSSSKPAGVPIDRMDSLDQNAAEDGEGPSAAFGIGAFDPQKLMLAGPVFFLLGLVAGLALFCTAFIRRRRRSRHRSPHLPSYSASLTPIPRKYLAPAVGHKFPARSVLAARTAATSSICYGQNGAPVGFIGTPIGTISMPGLPQSCPSSNTSTASSATVESRLVGTNGSSKSQQTTQKKQPPPQIVMAHQSHHRPLQPPRPTHPADQNFFADNTARFFMSPSTTTGTGSTKNVHF